MEYFCNIFSQQFFPQHKCFPALKAVNVLCVFSVPHIGEPYKHRLLYFEDDQGEHISRFKRGGLWKADRTRELKQDIKRSVGMSEANFRRSMRENSLAYARHILQRQGDYTIIQGIDSAIPIKQTLSRHEQFSQVRISDLIFHRYIPGEFLGREYFMRVSLPHQNASSMWKVVLVKYPDQCFDLSLARLKDNKDWKYYMEYLSGYSVGAQNKALKKIIFQTVKRSCEDFFGIKRRRTPHRKLVLPYADRQTSLLTPFGESIIVRS